MCYLVLVSQHYFLCNKRQPAPADQNQQSLDVIHTWDQGCMLTAGGLLQLFSATGDTALLQWSQQLQATLDELFWDDASGKQHAPSDASAVSCR